MENHTISKPAEHHIRRWKPVRFLSGFLLTAAGVSSILLVGVSLIHVRRVGSEYALPLVGMSVLVGVMCLGGGFGLMATAAGGFDEAEFDRLMTQGPAVAMHDAADRTADECHVAPPLNPNEFAETAAPPRDDSTRDCYDAPK